MNIATKNKTKNVTNEHNITTKNPLVFADIKSYEPRKKPEPTFYYTGWLIGILIMVYYNALYNWVVFIIPYITQPTKVFFIAHRNIKDHFQAGPYYSVLDVSQLQEVFQRKSVWWAPTIQL